jgi:hypothetical protein
MRLLKLINELPYLLFVTGLPFVVISFTFVPAASVLRHTSSWWLLIAVPLIAALSGFFLGLKTLRKWGLGYSATMSELTEAMKRN